MNETPVRISDHDRERVVALLQRHTGEGRLTLDEFSERAGRVYAARTRAELAPTLDGLPESVETALAPPPPPKPAPARRPRLPAFAITPLMVLPLAFLVVALTGRWFLIWPVLLLAKFVGGERGWACHPKTAPADPSTS